MEAAGCSNSEPRSSWFGLVTESPSLVAADVDVLTRRRVLIIGPDYRYPVSLLQDLKLSQN